jgi:beta-glucanase (GH16 family)
MRFVYLLALVWMIASCAGSRNLKETDKATHGKWKMVWNDEFDYQGLPDSLRWGYDVGGNGWGNNELQYYTKADTSNVEVKEGKLLIRAIKKAKEGRAYTSVRLISKNKGDWRYGRIVIRAKLPSGRGLWPAIWMLPTDWKYGNWPGSGEIDIMEHVGYNPDSVYFSIHTKSFNHMIGTQKTAGIALPDNKQVFHNYAIEWSKDKIDFYMDDQLVLTFNNTGKGSEEWPFDQRFHLLLNIAVGGNWGGVKGVDDTIFPGVMEVAYVRVFQ